MVSGASERVLGPRGSRSPISEHDPAGPLGDAARQVLAAIPAWWSQRAAAHGLTGSWLDVTAAIDTSPPINLSDTADDGGRDLSALDPYGVGAAYVTALSRDVRARHGRHYTPIELAEHLWVMARTELNHVRKVPKRLDGLVRDPSCGGGALLLPPLREHLTASADTDPAVVLARLPNLIEGVDLDPHAVWVANVVMAAEMLPTLAKVPAKRRHPLPALCHVGDGLQAGGRDAAAVLMNPPYGRVKLSDDERERFAHALYGHANLYGLFMAAGLDDLGEGGVLAALVPTSWTSGLYFRNLRETLGTVAPLLDVTFVVERGGVFDDVLQETCLAVFSARRGRTTTIASMNGHVAKVGKVARPHGPGPWLLPRRSDDAVIAVAAAAMPNTLASSGWGVSTGPLVWNRRSGDLYARNGKDRLPVIWAADIDGGTLHQDPARDSMRYLRMRAGDLNTLVLDECALLVQRTTAPEQARRIVAAPLDAATLATWGGQVVVENHVNVLRPTVLAPLLTQGLLTRLFASPTIDRVARCLSGSVALSAFELEALPLPDAATLARWELLTDMALEKAITDEYRPQAS